jgi:hypothetical protein
VGKASRTGASDPSEGLGTPTPPFFVSDRKDMYLREGWSVSDRKHWGFFDALWSFFVCDRKDRYLGVSRGAANGQKAAKPSECTGEG